MAGLINYDLQQSPESAMKTGDIVDRYEWAPGIQQLERTAEGALNAYEKYQKRLKEDAAKQQKIQENIDESSYEREMRQLSIELDTVPNVTSSERIRRIQEIDDMYSHLDPAKRSAIRKTTGLGDEYNISYNLSTQRGQEFVAQQKELDNSYMNLARAFAGDKVDSMTPEEQIQLGKKIENEKLLNNSNIQYLTSGNVDESLAPSVQTTSALSLQNAITEDANRHISAGGSLDYEWVNNEAAVMLNQLQNSGYSPEQAAALTQKSMMYYRRNADYLAKNQDEAAKVKANSKKMMADQYAVNLQDMTGMPLDVNLALLNNLQYITDLEAKQKALGTIDQLYAARLNNYTANSYLTPSTLYNASALNSVARPGASIQAPAASLMYALGHQGEFTRGQLTNQGLVLNEVLNANTVSPTERLEMTQENVDAYLNASANNAAKWTEMTQELLPALTDQFDKATPEQKRLIKDSYNKTMYNFLEDTLEKVARDTRGAITYSDGVLTSNYKFDRDTLKEANSILNEMRNISYNSKGATDGWKEVDNRIKRLVADKSLGLENKSDVGSDILAGINWLSAALGGVMNTEQGQALVMTPREAARTSANMRRMGVSSPISNFVEGVLSWGGLREGITNAVSGLSPDSLLEQQNSQRGIAPGEREALDLVNNYAAVSKIEKKAIDSGAIIGSDKRPKMWDARGATKFDKDIKQRIKNEESLRLESYKDASNAKQNTIGYGFNIEAAAKSDNEEFKAAVDKIAPTLLKDPTGYHKISKEQAEKLLDLYIEKVAIPDAIEVSQMYDVDFNSLSDLRKQALIDMAYQNGRASKWNEEKHKYTGGLISFEKMFQGIREGDWNKAFEEALDSSYYRGHPQRAYTNAVLLAGGEI